VIKTVLSSWAVRWIISRCIEPKGEPNHGDACLDAGLSRRMLFGAGVGVLSAATLVGTAQAQPARRSTRPMPRSRVSSSNARYVSGKMNERDFIRRPRRARAGLGAVRRDPGLCRFAGRIAVVANVRFNVQRLQEATPILADMIKAGKLRVVGGFYDLPTGKVILV
jgi:hypothetical protein